VLPQRARARRAALRIGRRGGLLPRPPWSQTAGSLADWPTQHRLLDRVEHLWLPGAPLYSACFAQFACNAALQGSVPPTDNGRGCDVVTCGAHAPALARALLKKHSRCSGRDGSAAAELSTCQWPPCRATAALCCLWPRAHPLGRACPCQWAADPSPRRPRPRRPRPPRARRAPRRRPRRRPAMQARLRPPPPHPRAATARPPRSPRRRRRPARRAAAARPARRGQRRARRRSLRQGFQALNPG